MNTIKRILIVPTLLMPLLVMAGTRNEMQLQQMAQNVLNGSSAVFKVAVIGDMSVYSSQSGGFAIISDAESPRLLAYSRTAPLGLETGNPGFDWWLRSIQRLMQTPGAQHAPTTKPDTTRFPSHVDALITTRWGQREPFKFMCPFDTWVPNRDLDGTYQPDLTHYVVGCGPTAMAQYMNYYKFPPHAVGQDSVVVKYNVPGQGTVEVTYCVDFEQENYDWANMIDDYQGDYTPQQGEAVARLCYHCGVAAHSTYNNLGTGTNDVNILDAFIRHFNYNDTAHYIIRSKYDEPTWMEMVYTELSAGHPILYSAKDINLELGIIGGHNFIIDGYDENGMVHVNWGWYGLEDGYYDIALLNPQMYTYDDWQAMYVGLYPNQEQLRGDVTEDGQVDVSDVNAVINMMLGKTELRSAADINNDGNVDVSDVNAVINIMLGKE